jgi:outer-membrane receptor for ferric coprogen and ferric-rhodotorulic acid
MTISEAAMAFSPRLRCALASALLTTTALGGAGCIAPAAAQAQALRNYDVPAGPMAVALNRFAEQAGIKLFYDSALTSGVSTTGLQGRYGVAEALPRILSGSGLTYRQTGSGGFTLEPAPAAGTGAVQLGPVRVEGDGASRGEAYAGYDPAEKSDPYAKMVNPPTGVASKTPLTQREIPQSVSVVTQEQIRQTNATSLGDVMRRVPGVFVQKSDSGRMGYITRGFNIDNYQIDGVPTRTSLLQTDPDLVAYDRVEVLRGPAGLLNAMGSAGGTINLVYKKPRSEFAASAEVRAGSFNNYYQQVDVSGPLNADKSLRARVAEALSTDDTPRRGAKRRNTSLYGVVDYDASESTLLRVGISYHRLFDRDQYSGYPAYSNYTLIPGLRRVFLGADWNHETYDTLRAFTEIEQTIGNWSVKLNGNFTRTKFDWLASYAQGAVNPTTNMTNAVRLKAGPSQDRQVNVDLFASGPIEIPGIEATLTVGFNYLHDFMDQKNQYISRTNLLGSVPVDIFDYDAP